MKLARSYTSYEPSGKKGFINLFLTVCWKAPYEDAIKRISRLGFKGVELIAWDRKTLDEYYTPRKIRELRELVSSLGMEITEFVSTRTSF